MATSIGQRIKKFRLDANLNLPQLAEKTGITKGYLWQLEEGQTKNPTLDTLVKIAKAVDKTVSEIIHGKALFTPTKGERTEIPRSLNEFIVDQQQRGESLTPDDIQMLAQIHYRGRSPRNLQDWQTLYSVIKSVSRKK